MLKQKLWRQFLPMLLSFAMLLGEMPLTALAAEDDQQDVAIEQLVGSDELDTFNEGEAATTDGSTELAKAVIKVDWEKLKAAVKSTGGCEAVDDTTHTIYKDYVWKGESSYGKYALDMIEAAKRSTGTTPITVEIDEVDKGLYGSDPLLVYKWQKKGSDGSFADMITAETTDPELPIDAGTYRLVVSREADAGCAAAAEVTVADLEIRKRELKIGNYNTSFSTTSGLTVADVKKLNTLDTVEIYRVNDAIEQARFIKDGTFSAKVQKLVNGVYTDITDEKEVLKQGEDYLLVFSLELQDDIAVNYEIKDLEFPIYFKNGKRRAEIAITSEAVRKGYTGNPIELAESEYSYKVLLKKTSVGTESIPDDEPLDVKLVGAWCDASKNPYKDPAFVPTEAGTYYYRLALEDASYEADTVTTESYTAENGETYACAYVWVEIQMLSVEIKPEVESGSEFSVGMTVNDVLDKVKDYTVQVVSGGDITKDVDKTSFWGTYPNAAAEGTTQYYQPVFGVQRGEEIQGVGDKKETVWEPNFLKGYNTIEKGYENSAKKFVPYKYRIVFTGEKAVYNAGNGSVAKTLGINESQHNYTVDISEKAIGRNAYEFTPKDTLIWIKVDKILEKINEKGAAGTFADPIINTWTGKDIFANKGEYKLATVDVTDGDAVRPASDYTLNYQWQFATRINETPDAQGVNTFSVKENDWANLTWNDVENQTAPRAAGLYRLKISYNDPTRTTYAKDAYIYYVIKPQDLLVKLEGKPVVYADGVKKTSDILKKLQDKNAEEAGTYLQAVVYDATVTDENGVAKVTPAETAKALATRIMAYPQYYLRVEKKVLVSEGVYAWETCCEWDDEEYGFTNDEIVQKGTEYRISLRPGVAENRNYSRGGSYSDDTAYRTYLGRAYSDPSYNFGQKLNKYNRVDKAADADYYYGVGAADITLKDTHGVAVNVSVEASKLTNRVKVYDGEPFNIDAVKSAIRLIDVNGDDVSETLGAKLVYKFIPLTLNSDGSVDYSSDPIDVSEAVHAGSYALMFSYDTDDTYLGFSYIIGYNAGNYNIKYTIKPREVVIRPLLKSGIKAGTPYNQLEKILKNSYREEFRGYRSNKNDFITIYGWNVQESYEVVDAVTGEKLDRTIITLPREKKVDGETIDYYHSFEAFKVYKSDGTQVSADDPDYKYNLNVGRFKHDQTYYVKIDISAGYITWESSDYKKDYILTSELAAFNVEQVAARVEQNGVAISHKSELKSGIYSHTVVPQAGVSIPFDQAKKGNYFSVNIYAPVEYQGITVQSGKSGFEALGFVFENVIEAAGGAVIGGGRVVDSTTNEALPYITVMFNADKTAKINAANEGVHTFDIIWEKDYKETFTIDLSQATLQADFSRAVQPKGLKFTAKKATMTVGDTKQLDVKITRKQKNDVILLGYTVDSGKDVVAVNDSGFVTALAKGTAKVTVYPCVMQDGVKTRIAKAKAATITITVKDVSKPTGVKVTVTDTYVDVQYKKPSNGARREIYILPKSLKEKDFTAELGKVVNGNYSAFTAKRFLVSEATNAKSVVTQRIYGLDPNTAYTVYVRNVSGLRTLEGGQSVAASSAGAVKAFKTKKSRVLGLRADFGKGEENKLKLWNSSTNRFEAKLSDKTAKLSVEGKFYERYLKEYSDWGDFVWRALPMKSAEAKLFDTMKLSYYAYDESRTTWGVKDSKATLFVPGTYVDNNNNVIKYTNVEGAVTGTNYYASAVASVNKSGVVTFKSRGTVCIMARDSVSGQAVVVRLYVDAKEDTMKVNTSKAKSGVITMMPGTKGIMLSDYLEYYEGKVKLADGSDGQLTVAEESDEYFNIERRGKDYYIEALKPGTKTITVSNSKVGGSGISVKLKASDIEQIKSLKKASMNSYYEMNGYYEVGVQHNKFAVTFTYPYESYTFRMEAKDASGRIAVSEIVELDGRLDAKKKVYVYEYTFSGAGIDRQLSYSVKVDAVYQNPETGEDILPTKKSSPLKVKTTNLAASYTALASKLYTNKTTGAYLNFNVGNTLANGQAVTPYYGGVEIYAQNLSGSSVQLSYTSTVFKAGNNYTLSLPTNNTGSSITSDDYYVGGFNYYANKMKTDTLTWKSKSSKVATVKALPGTYTATLKAVASGSTIIEVSSKQTKKVIARYLVRVAATGDADDNFGDYEPYAAFKYATANARDVIELTLDTPVTMTLNNQEAQWYVFEAPAYGSYSINTAYGNGAYIVDSMDDITLSTEKSTVSVASGSGKIGGGYSNTWTRSLEKGTKKYIYLYGSGKSTITVTGNICQDITVGDNVVKGNTSVRLIAPEDNTYRIAKVDSTGKADPISWNNGASARLKRGESATAWISNTESYIAEYTIRVTKIELDGALTPGGDPVEMGEIDKDTEKWYVFTANEDNKYKFSTEGAKTTLSMYFYKDLMSDDYTDGIKPDVSGGESVYELPVEKDGKRYVKIKLNNVDAEKEGEEAVVVKKAKIRVDATIELSKPKDKDGKEVDALSVGEDFDLGTFADKDTVKWFAFTAPRKGNYNFIWTDEDGEIMAEGYEKLNGTRTWDSLKNKMLGVYMGKYEVSLEKDQTIYLKVFPLSLKNSKKPMSAKLTIATRKLETDVLTANEYDAKEPKVVEVATTSAPMKETQEKWYRFIAPEYNYYNFTLSGAKKVNSILACYSELEQSETDTRDWAKLGAMDVTLSNIQLEARQSVYLRVIAGADEDELKLTVTKRKMVKLDLVSAGDIELTNLGEAQWFEFAAPTTDYYTVIAATDKEVKLEAYYDPAGKSVVSLAKPLDSNYMSPVRNVKSWENLLQAGTKLYIKVTKPGSDAAKGLIAVRARGSATELKSGDDVLKLEKQFDQTWLKITADEANVYTLKLKSKDEAKKFKADQIAAGIRDACNTACEESNDNSKNETEFTLVFASPGTQYVRLYNPGADAVELTATLSARKPTEITAAGVDIALESGEGKVDSAWYSFTAPESGFYTLTANNVKEGSFDIEYYEKLSDTSKADDPWNSAGVLDGVLDMADDYTNSLAQNSEKKEFWENFMLKGQTVYMKIGLAAGSTKATAALQAVKAEPEAFKENATTKTMEAVLSAATKEDAKWYVYTAAARDLYTFYATVAKAADGKTARAKVSVYYEYKTNSYKKADLWNTDLIGSGRNNAIDITAGSSADATCMIPPLKLAGTQKVYFKVTPDFTTNSSSADSSVTVTLEAGKPEVKETPLTMAADGNKIELTGSKDVWYALSVNEVNRYIFNAAAVDKDNNPVYVKCEYFVGKDVATARGPYYSSTVPVSDLKATDKIFVRISCSSASADNKVTVTLKITKTVVESEKLSANASANVKLSSKKPEAWYELNASAWEDNCYTFYSDNVSGGDVYVYVYDSLASEYPRDDDLGVMSGDKKATGKYKSNEVGIAKGKTVYVKLALKDESKGVDATLRVKKREVTTMYTSGNDAYTNVSIMDGEEKWYAYTVRKDGSYGIALDELQNGSLRVDVYKDLLRTSPDWDDLKATPHWINSKLKEGDKLYIKLTAEATEAEQGVTATLKVLEARSNPSQISVGGSNRFSATEDKWYNCNVGRPGTYTFVIDNVQNGSIAAYAYRGQLEVRSSDYVYVGSKSSGAVNVTVNEATDIYLKVQISGRTDEKTPVSYRITAAERLWDETQISWSLNYSTRYFAYTVGDTGVYDFIISDTNLDGGRLDMYPYNANFHGSSDCVYDGHAGFAGISAEAGTTIYLRVEPGALEGELHMSATLRVQKRQPAIDRKLRLDDPISIHLNAGEERWYAYVPDQEYTYYAFRLEDMENVRLTMCSYQSLENGRYSSKEDVYESDTRKYVYVYSSDSDMVYLRIKAGDSPVSATLRVVMEDEE